MYQWFTNNLMTNFGDVSGWGLRIELLYFILLSGWNLFQNPTQQKTVCHVMIITQNLIIVC